MFTSVKNVIFLFVAALLTGLSFEAGRFILSASLEHEQARAALARSKITGVVDSPEGLSVEDVTVSANRSGVRFVGVIRNSGDMEWIDPTVSMSLTIAGVHIRPCSKSLTLSLLPGEQRKFSLDCHDLQVERIPTDFSFTPIIESAWYERSSEGVKRGN